MNYLDKLALILGNPNRKKIIYFDLDGVMADFDGKPSYKDDPTIPMEGFFASLDPIDGALEAFRKLSPHYECYFLTTVPWSNVYGGTEKRIWVEKMLGELAFKRLITSHHKNLQIGDYLIDDRTANGAGEFLGEHIHFGTERFPNWAAVLKYLLPDLEVTK